MNCGKRIALKGDPKKMPKVPLLMLLMLPTCIMPSSGQRNEASEMPEDCAADQYFNLAESRCENCSDALRVFESAISSYQDWQQPSNNNEANPPTQAPLLVNSSGSGSGSGKQDDQKAAHLARLGQRLPQLTSTTNSSNSVSRTKPNTASSSSSVTPLGGGGPVPTTGAGGAKVRQTTTGSPTSANAILSRLVMKSSYSQAAGGGGVTREPNGEAQIGPEMGGVGGGPLADDTFHDSELESGLGDYSTTSQGDLSSGQRGQQQQQQQQMGRTTKHWLRLLGRFLQSQELHQLNILESIRQCKQNLNTTSCQMWSNLCVLTMYAHSSDNSARRFPSNPTPAAHMNLQRQHQHHQQQGQHYGRQQSQRQRRPPMPDGGSDQDHSNPEGGAGFRTSWQKCPKFSLTSVCNGLRDWHQYDKQQAQLDWANIYADDDTIGGSVGGTGGASGIADQVTSTAKIGGRSMALNEPIQLLAYKYALDGQLVEVSQFGLADFGQFCVTSSRSNLDTRQARARMQDNLNLFVDANYFRLSNSNGDDNSGSGEDGGGDVGELVGSRQMKVGQNMRMSCKFSSLQANLFASSQLNETIFVDLFMAHSSPSGTMFIKPVPVLIKNLLYNGVPVNARYAHDPSRWKLVNRFFHHATLKLETRPPTASSADDSLPSPPEPIETTLAAGFEDEVLVYAKSASFELNYRRDFNDKSLAISSILLQLEYDYVSLVRSKLRQALLSPSAAINGSGGGSGSGSGSGSEQVNIGDSVARLSLAKLAHESTVKLSQNLADMAAVKKDFDLFLTIACLISCIWSLIKCYNIQRFQGSIHLDIYSLFLFMIIGCDVIADLMGLITISFGLYLFVSVKLHDRPLFGSGAYLGRQQQVVFAPNSQLESALMVNLQLALVFKLVGLIYKFYVRLRSDQFFIDWERPKMLTSAQMLHHYNTSRSVTSSTAKAMNNTNHQLQQQQQQISFWRQYSVINRWLQLQTVRRLNLTLQLILFATLIDYFKLDQFATADASLKTSQQTWLASALVADHCATFRAVILAAVYVALAAGQVLYKRCLHEPMIRSQVREFIDLCSVGNVSLFAMLYARFGFYIHGRNANGSSECGIGEMNALLEREERDLCSKRGLLPNTDQQTFVLVLPKIITDHYRKLLYSRAAIGDPAAQQQQQQLPPSFLSGASPSATAAGLLGLNSPAASGNESTKDISSLIKSSLNLSSSLSSSATSGAGGRQHRQNQSLIESMVARNRAVNMFLINYLDHIYKDIDYEVRERKRFESLLLLDSDLDVGYSDGDLIGGTGGGARRAPQTATKLSTGPVGGAGQLVVGAGGIFSSMRPADAIPAARGAFYVDSDDSFMTLLWLGLEWDLILFELILLLNVDAWLGHARLLVTVSLIWLVNKLTRALYSSWARSNLVFKSMLDEKFLVR